MMRGVVQERHEVFSFYAVRFSHQGITEQLVKTDDQKGAFPFCQSVKLFKGLKQQRHAIVFFCRTADGTVEKR